MEEVSFIFLHNFGSVIVISDLHTKIIYNLKFRTCTQVQTGASLRVKLFFVDSISTRPTWKIQCIVLTYISDTHLISLCTCLLMPQCYPITLFDVTLCQHKIHAIDDLVVFFFTMLEKNRFKICLIGIFNHFTTRWHQSSQCTFMTQRFDGIL